MFQLSGFYCRWRLRHMSARGGNSPKISPSCHASQMPLLVSLRFGVIRVYGLDFGVECEISEYFCGWDKAGIVAVSSRPDFAPSFNEHQIALCSYGSLAFSTHADSRATPAK